MTSFIQTRLASLNRSGLMLYFAAVAVLTTATASVLASANILPAEQTSQGVSYVTGGIAQDESIAIKEAMPRYPLVVEVYHQDGGKNEYTASAAMSIATSEGQPVMNATLQGPFALVRLQSGRYDIKVELDGQVKQDRVEVKNGASTRAVFVFKDA